MKVCVLGALLVQITFKGKFVKNDLIMKGINIRQKLHEFIDTIEDKKAEAIYTLLIGETDIDEERKKLVLSEREEYLRGEGKSHSWDEVKQMALNKEKRHAI